LRLEGLLQHRVEAFGRGLKVDTAVEQKNLYSSLSSRVID
jgi:hypothetical protein